MNKKYKVKVNVERGKDIYLSVTHNGWQWTSINIYDSKREIPLIVDALQRHLTNAMHSDGQSDAAKDIWTNEDESAEIEQQIVEDARR